MAISNHDRVGKALELLKAGLAPFVEREVKGAIESRRLSAHKLRGYAEDRLLADKPIAQWDAAGLLKLMWETWNEVFRRVLGPAERGLAGELRDHRNRWAHQERFSSDDAKLAGNCLLVVSLPASDTAGSPHTGADDVEVGGQRGREALDRLRNVVGRIELSWRPASAEEGFEIVRRRLFEPFSDPAQFKDRDVVARAFADFYRRDCARDRLRGPGHLCQTKIYRGEGVWHCERGVGIPAILSSRATSGARRAVSELVEPVESGLHGLESEADVRFEGLRACSRQVGHRQGFCCSRPRACRGGVAVGMSVKKLV